MAKTTPPASGDTEVLKLREPADMVAAVPYLLGFHPSNSVVVVSLRGPRRRFGLTQRADLPPPAYVDDVVAGLADRLVADGAGEALVVVYPPDEDYDDRAFWQALSEALAHHGLGVKDALRVADGRWWSYLCEVPACCPPGGTPIVPPNEPGGPARVAATMVHAGMVALPDRAALRATLRPLVGLARLAMDQALERAEVDLLSRADDVAGRAAYHAESVLLLDAALASCRDGDPRTMRDDDVARLLLGLLTTSVRDSVADAVLAEPADESESARDTLAAAIALCTELVRRGTPPYDVAPAALLAIAAWRSGNGALARCAVERALAGDPAYRLARLVEQLLDHAVNPALLRGGGRSRQLPARGSRSGPLKRRR